MTPIDPALLAKLVCPVTRTPLHFNDAREELVSDAAGLAFPIRDGIPMLAARAARELQAGR